MYLVVPIVAANASEPDLALTVHIVVCGDASGKFIHASTQVGDVCDARVTQRPGNAFHAPPISGPRNILDNVEIDCPPGGPIMQFELDGEIGV